MTFISDSNTWNGSYAYLNGSQLVNISLSILANPSPASSLRRSDLRPIDSTRVTISSSTIQILGPITTRDAGNYSLTLTNRVGVLIGSFMLDIHCKYSLFMHNH